MPKCKTEIVALQIEMQEANTLELCARIKELELALHVEREKSRHKDALIDALQAHRQADPGDDDADYGRCGCFTRGMTWAKNKNQKQTRGQTRDGAREICNNDTEAERTRAAVLDTDGQGWQEQEKVLQARQGGPQRHLREGEEQGAASYGPMTLEQHRIEESTRRPAPQPPAANGAAQETNALGDGQSPGARTSFSKRSSSSSRRVVFAQDVKEEDANGALNCEPAEPGETADTSEPTFFRSDLGDMQLSQMSQSFTASRVKVEGRGEGAGVGARPLLPSLLACLLAVGAPTPGRSGCGLDRFSRFGVPCCFWPALVAFSASGYARNATQGKATQLAKHPYAPAAELRLKHHGQDASTAVYADAARRRAWVWYVWQGPGGRGGGSRWWRRGGGQDGPRRSQAAALPLRAHRRRARGAERAQVVSCVFLLMPFAVALITPRAPALASTLWRVWAIFLFVRGESEGQDDVGQGARRLFVGRGRRVHHACARHVESRPASGTRARALSLSLACALSGTSSEEPVTAQHSVHVAARRGACAAGGGGGGSCPRTGWLADRGLKMVVGVMSQVRSICKTASSSTPCPLVPPFSLLPLSLACCSAGLNPQP